MFFQFLWFAICSLDLQVDVNTEVGVIRDIRLKELRLYTDYGRCSRPLFIVEKQRLLIKKKDIRALQLRVCIVEAFSASNNTITSLTTHPFLLLSGIPRGWWMAWSCDKGIHRVCWYRGRGDYNDFHDYQCVFFNYLYKILVNLFHVVRIHASLSSELSLTTLRMCILLLLILSEYLMYVMVPFFKKNHLWSINCLWFFRRILSLQGLIQKRLILKLTHTVKFTPH